MRTLPHFLIALLTLLFSATTASADTPEMQEDEIEEDLREQEKEGASPQDIERAQEYFDKGAQAYYEGEYGQAAVEFRRAHEIYPHPVFLHNVAVVNKRLGRLAEAREAAGQVLQMDEQLPPEQDARNRGIIHGADASLHADDLAETIAESLDHDELDDVDEPPAVADDSGLGAVGFLGIGSLGLGVAGLIGGSVVHFQLQEPQEEYEKRRIANPGDSEVIALGEEVSRQETQRVVLFTAGGTLAALGTALIILDVRSGSSDSDLAISVPLDRPGITASFRW